MKDIIWYLLFLNGEIKLRRKGANNRCLFTRAVHSQQVIPMQSGYHPRYNIPDRNYMFSFKKVMSYRNCRVINMMTTYISPDTYNYRRVLFVEPADFGLSAYFKGSGIRGLGV